MSCRNAFVASDFRAEPTKVHIFQTGMSRGASNASVNIDGQIPQKRDENNSLTLTWWT